MFNHTAPLKGKFIVIEGADYCGKGSQHRMLGSYLLDHPLDRDNKYINVVMTREPFNTEYTQEIRQILKESKYLKDSARRLFGLYISDRELHVVSLIEPLTDESGVIVLSDRYKYSTEAYQSLQGIPLEEILKAHEDMPVPDLALFIKVPVEERLRRKAAVKDRPYDEVFEKDHEFQKNLDAQYDALVKIHSDENIVVIDGNRPKDQVFEDIKTHVDKLLFNK
jgi:dTMP kinase